MNDGQFPERMLLALKALSLSRGRLASELAVDKSVVSRWLNGRQAPSGENLARLTALIAERRPGFTLLDWESDLDTLAARLGVADGAGTGPSWGSLGEWLPEPVLQEALAVTDVRGEAYEGIWRSTRPAIGMPGRFIHDQILIRRAANGFLSFRLRVEDMSFNGWTFPSQTQLFSTAVDPRSGVFIFAIFNAVTRHRAEVLDGLTLTLQRVGGGSPVAGAVLLERTGDLTGDAEADDAAYEASIPASPLAPEGSIPDTIRKHLLRDVGPAAMASGGMALLAMPFAESMSRGPLIYPTDTASG